MRCRKGRGEGSRTTTFPFPSPAGVLMWEWCLTDGSVVHPQLGREKAAKTWLFLVRLVPSVLSPEGDSHALAPLHAAEPEPRVWLEQIGLPVCETALVDLDAIICSHHPVAHGKPLLIQHVFQHSSGESLQVHQSREWSEFRLACLEKWSTIGLSTTLILMGTLFLVSQCIVLSPSQFSRIPGAARSQSGRISCVTTPDLAAFLQARFGHLCI